MNFEKIVFAFFTVLALTLNFGFFIGDIDNIDHHNVYEFFAAIVVSLIATVLKIGDRSQTGAILLATSLVADLQLVTAAIVWAMAAHMWESGLTPSTVASIVSLSGGAVVANILSVVLLVIDAARYRR